MIFNLLAYLMATPNLPATEDTRADLNYFEAVNTNNDTIPFLADDDYEAGDMILWGPYVGIVNKDVASGSWGSLRDKDGILVTTRQVATGSTFATVGNPVWFNETTGEVSDTEAAGLVDIGPLATALDANSVISFYKRRYYVESELT